MKVSGIDYSTGAELMSALERLPSSFPHYSSARAPLDDQPLSVTTKINEAVILSTEGKYQQSEKKFLEALVTQRNLQKTSPSASLSNTEANLLSNISTLQAIRADSLATSAQEEAKELRSSANRYSQESIKAFEASGDTSGLETALKIRVSLFDRTEMRHEYQHKLTEAQANGDTKSELTARLALGADAKQEGKFDEAASHYGEAFKLNQGALDYNAHMVAQREVAFSDSEKLGTDNLQQCVAMIIHDPLNKKTALAHIDRFTDPSSISTVLSQFETKNSLNIYLAGGRDLSEHGNATSQENIRKSLDELKKDPRVDIKAADIGEKGSPSAVVFDPKTASLSHAVPGIRALEAERTAIIEAAFSSTPTIPLRQAFDFSKSKTVPQVEFTEEQKAILVAKGNYLSHTNLGKGEMATAAQIYPIIQTARNLAPPPPGITQSHQTGSHEQHGTVTTPPTKGFFSTVGSYLKSKISIGRPKATSSPPVAGTTPKPSPTTAALPHQTGSHEQHGTVTTPPTKGFFSTVGSYLKSKISIGRPKATSSPPVASTTPKPSPTRAAVPHPHRLRRENGSLNLPATDSIESKSASMSRAMSVHNQITNHTTISSAPSTIAVKKYTSSKKGIS